MTELSQSGDSVKCSFCIRPAIWHFGTELWQRPWAYVMARFTIRGEALHTCGDCGLRLRRWADKQADREAYREMMSPPVPTVGASPDRTGSGD